MTYRFRICSHAHRIRYFLCRKEGSIFFSRSSSAPPEFVCSCEALSSSKLLNTPPSVCNLKSSFVLGDELRTKIGMRDLDETPRPVLQVFPFT